VAVGVVEQSVQMHVAWATGVKRRATYHVHAKRKAADCARSVCQSVCVSVCAAHTTDCIAIPFAVLECAATTDAFTHPIAQPLTHSLILSPLTTQSTTHRFEGFVHTGPLRLRSFVSSPLTLPPAC
jgi:hypothetical protein